MTNQEILKTAMQQSAVDLNCHPDDFISVENKVVISVSHEQARKYLELPFHCNLVSYGSNIVASVDSNAEHIVREYINQYSLVHCFETPNMHVLNDAFQAAGYRICFMAEYFLPDITYLAAIPCRYDIKILSRGDFDQLYTPQWSNALCQERRHLDVLGAAAYDNGQLVGLAGCSADCDTMWQIGVDVLTEYQRQGIASALTSRLALEILDRGRVPFYCAAWSNIRSVRNAIKSGFRPAWVEMTSRRKDFVDKMNKEE